ncbi:MAG: hypothetical protein DHS20C10_02830 [marine bacterium B5-7]|nr:MAG: hypothetical protein DHS20C10_02830 [marine bacterium B5-7]
MLNDDPPQTDTDIEQWLIAYELLLCQMSDDDLKDVQGLSALHYAAAQSDFELIKLLLANERVCQTLLRDEVLKDSGGLTALHYAAAIGELRIINALLASECVCQALLSEHALKNDDGDTALHCAAENEDAEAVTALLAHKDARNALLSENALKNKFGKTALHCAVKEGHVESVKALLAYEEARIVLLSNAGLKDQFERAVLHLAVEEGHAEVVAVLLSYDDVCNALLSENALKNKFGETALHCAVKNGDTEIVTALLANEDVCAAVLSDNALEDGDGITALQYAEDRGDIEVAACISRAMVVAAMSKNNKEIARISDGAIQASEQPHDYLSSLPAELLVSIFLCLLQLTPKYAVLQQYLILCSVCKKFKEIAQESTLWRNVFRQHYSVFFCHHLNSPKSLSALKSVTLQMRYIQQSGSALPSSNTSEDSSAKVFSETDEVQWHLAYKQALLLENAVQVAIWSSIQYGWIQVIVGTNKRILKCTLAHLEKVIQHTAQNTLSAGTVLSIQPNPTKEQPTAKACLRYFSHDMALLEAVRRLDLNEFLTIVFTFAQEVFGDSSRRDASVVWQHSEANLALPDRISRSLGDDFGTRLFHWALLTDQPEALREGIQKTGGMRQYPALIHMAAALGANRCLQALLDSWHIDEIFFSDAILRRGPQNQTALHYAAFHGQADAINILLGNEGMHVRLFDNDALKDKLGRTALHLAVSQGYLGAVKALLANKRSRDVLLRRDALQCNAQGTALHSAVITKNVDIVKVLLDDKGALEILLAQYGLKDSAGRTPLSCAAKYGYADLVKILLAHEGARDLLLGGDALTDNEGKTALHHAAAVGHPQSMKFLLTNIPARELLFRENKLQDNDGQTALHVAAADGCAPTVNMLLTNAYARKALLHKDRLKDKKGRTALHRAATRGNTEMEAPEVVQVLFANKEAREILLGDSALEDNEGKTALQYAEEHGYTKIAACISQAVEDLAASKEGKHTPRPGN